MQLKRARTYLKAVLASVAEKGGHLCSMLDFDLYSSYIPPLKDPNFGLKYPALLYTAFEILGTQSERQLILDCVCHLQSPWPYWMLA